MARTYFFWDDLEDNIIEEYDEAGNTIADYTTEPDHFGNVIGQDRGGQSSFFHYDTQGSTLAVTAENQNVTDTFAYSAFGEVTERTGTTEVPFQYIGQKGYYTDGLTGQIMVRRRPYEPARARWLTVDPPRVSLWLLHALKTSLYAYVSNSPISRWDPSGLKDEMMCDSCNKMLMRLPPNVDALNSWYPFTVYAGVVALTSE